MQRFLEAKEWSLHQVNLQPMSRKLFEHLSREEWTEAAQAAEDLVRVANRIYIIACVKELERGNHT